MTERILNSYKRLFEVWVLHHFWLDDGLTVYDLIEDKNTKNAHLQAYNASSILTIQPTASTKNQLEGIRGIFKNTALGFVVSIPSDSQLTADTTFEFVISVRDSNFFNYTALTLRPQNLYEIYNRLEDKVVRFKSNVPVFSNLTGAYRTVELNKALFLSKEIPELPLPEMVESFFRSGNSLMQLTADQPNAGSWQIHPNTDDLPVFVNQADVNAIIPPLGFDVLPPSNGLLLTEDIPDTTFALIQLSATRPNDTCFNFIDDLGFAKTPHPVFQIRFRNRATIWRYITKESGAIESEETVPLPLTFFGNSGSKQKPSEWWVKTEKSSTKITQLTSEIFV